MCWGQGIKILGITLQSVSVQDTVSCTRKLCNHQLLYHFISFFFFLPSITLLKDIAEGPDFSSFFFFFSFLCSFFFFLNFSSHIAFVHDLVVITIKEGNLRACLQGEASAGGQVWSCTVLWFIISREPPRSNAWINWGNFPGRGWGCHDTEPDINLCNNSSRCVRTPGCGGSELPATGSPEWGSGGGAGLWWGSQCGSLLNTPHTHTHSSRPRPPPSPLSFACVPVLPRMQCLSIANLQRQVKDSAGWKRVTDTESWTV